MANKTIAQIVSLVNLGANLEDVIPQGADPKYWRRIVANYKDPSTIKPKRKQSSHSRRASKRTFRADSVLISPIIRSVGRAMAEQVERVNADLEPRFINGEVEIF